jgi:hypothetical protein
MGTYHKESNQIRPEPEAIEQLAEEMVNENFKGLNSLIEDDDLREWYKELIANCLVEMYNAGKGSNAPQPTLPQGREVYVPFDQWLSDNNYLLWSTKNGVVKYQKSNVVFSLNELVEKYLKKIIIPSTIEIEELREKFKGWINKSPLYSADEKAVFEWFKPYLNVSNSQ